jgi:hypothetical protein
VSRDLLRWFGVIIFRLRLAVWRKVKQMQLTFSFDHPFASATVDPPFIPGKFFQPSGVFLAKFLKRRCRIVQHAPQFVRFLLGRGNSPFGPLVDGRRLPLQLDRLLESGQEESLAFGQIAG